MSVSERAPAPLTVVPERSFTRPGCDDRCTVLRAIIPGVFGRSELLLHDPDAHAEWGAWQCGVIDAQAHTVVTGTLAVNLSSLDVSVSGAPVTLTATELRILVHLARRVGQAVPSPDILTAVWGAADAFNAHILGTFVCRLRAKLGPAGGLITTLVRIGLRLDNLPAGAEPVGRFVVGAPRMTGWSKGGWTRCRRCESTEYPHGTHGFCRRWACRKAYRLGWRQEAAP